MRHVDVVVIGAGQAGLATSYYLSKDNIDHVVLDREGVGASWRNRRWDSFTLNAPNWTFRLPGYTYDGPDQDAFMPRDELVAEFTKYAARINAPVEAPVDVRRLEKADASFVLSTSAGDIGARAVVVATGAYQRRNRPPNTIDPAVLQLNTDQFRNAQALPPGGVLVIGSGQSGIQVAEDLKENGRPTWLATGSCGWIPRRMRGLDNVYWREQMGMFEETVDQLGHEPRLACPPIQTGVEGGRDANLTIAANRGVTLLGRYLGADGHTVHLKDDLQENAAGSDKPVLALRARLDSFIKDNAIDATDDPPIEPAGTFDPAPSTLDLKRENIQTVLWATGFKLDFESWIELDLNTRDGYPEQIRGISPHAGLYFMGLQLMHSRKSGLIFGVDDDARHVVGAAAAHLGAA